MPRRDSRDRLQIRWNQWAVASGLASMVAAAVTVLGVRLADTK